MQYHVHHIDVVIQDQFLKVYFLDLKVVYYCEKVGNIDYGNIDFEKVNFKSLISTPI